MHNKSYKYAPNDAINACDTASFTLSLAEVGLTPYLLYELGSWIHSLEYWVGALHNAYMYEYDSHEPFVSLSSDDLTIVETRIFLFKELQALETAMMMFK